MVTDLFYFPISAANIYLKIYLHLIFALFSFLPGKGGILGYQSKQTKIRCRQIGIFQVSPELAEFSNKSSKNRNKAGNFTEWNPDNLQETSLPAPYLCYIPSSSTERRDPWISAKMNKDKAPANSHSFLIIGNCQSLASHLSKKRSPNTFQVTRPRGRSNIL